MERQGGGPTGQNWTNRRCIAAKSATGGLPKTARNCGKKSVRSTELDQAGRSNTAMKRSPQMRHRMCRWMTPGSGRVVLYVTKSIDRHDGQAGRGR
jgi:hypothetical protein